MTPAQRMTEARARAQRMTEARALAITRVTALLAMTPHEAARWLAKWLITTDVKRGYTEQDIATGHQGYAGSLGSVAVESGRKIRVSNIGAPAMTWKDCPTGYQYEETFSLHVIYEELRAELAAPLRQLSLWGSQEVRA